MKKLILLSAGLLTSSLAFANVFSPMLGKSSIPSQTQITVKNNITSGKDEAIDYHFKSNGNVAASDFLEFAMGAQGSSVNGVQVEKNGLYTITAGPDSAPNTWTTCKGNFPGWNFSDITLSNYSAITVEYQGPGNCSITSLTAAK